MRPDWAEVRRELHRRDVTLALLWEEYKTREPDGFGYPSHARRRDASWRGCAAARGFLPWTVGTITRSLHPALTDLTTSATT